MEHVWPSRNCGMISAGAADHGWLHHYYRIYCCCYYRHHCYYCHHYYRI
eukprot:gene10989-biopygen161